MTHVLEVLPSKVKREMAPEMQEISIVWIVAFTTIGVTVPNIQSSE